MKLALDRPVKILIIGAGGTGGYVIPHLYRIAFASNRKCRIIIAVWEENTSATCAGVMTTKQFIVFPSIERNTAAKQQL